MSDPGHGPAAGSPSGPIDRELDVTWIRRFIVGVVALVALTFLGVIILAHVLKSEDVARDPAPSPLVEARQPPPRPRAALQADPTADMEKFLAQEKAVLDSYAWVDQAGGIARIPVSRAIDILAEKGLPVPEPLPAAPAAAPATGGSK